MKAQIEDALKNREEIVRIRNVVGDYQRRLEVATRDLEQSKNALGQVKTDRYSLYSYAPPSHRRVKPALSKSG